jgi:hypothetical protein
MENQNGTVDRMVEQLTDPRADFATPVAAAEPTSSVGTYATKAYSPAITAVPDGPEAESLYGSLSVFALSDVLTLLATTAQTGELLVVGDAAQGRLWFDKGDLVDAEVGSTATVNQAFFELACVTQGWFSFSSGRVSDDHSSSGTTSVTAVPVATVLAEVGPQVEEWRVIRELLPLEAIVTLSAEPPGEDVRIRNDQWRVLTQVGTSGHSVKSVLDTIGGDQIVGLRTLRDLHTAGLIDLEPLPGTTVPTDAVPPVSPLVADDSAASSPVASPPLVTATESDAGDLGSVPAPHPEDSETGDGAGTRLAEVTIMPPPIAADPWAPVVVPTEAEGDGVA